MRARRFPPRRWTAALALGLALAAGAAPPAAGGDGEQPAAAAEVPEAFRAWLEMVELLMTDEEREVFLALKSDHRRKIFIDRFWQVRDPFPETGANEFHATWIERVAQANERFGTLEGERPRALLVLGPPRTVSTAPCSRMLGFSELWQYQDERGHFYLLFVRGGVAPDGYRLWSPVEGLRTLVQWSARPMASDSEVLAELIENCVDGRTLVDALSRVLDLQLSGLFAKLPRPSSEWVRNFAARSTELPDGSETFEAEVSLRFPGRHQSRTVVQGLVSVPSAAVAAETGSGAPAFRFVVDGEVLREERLFDDFRYRFEMLAAAVEGDRIPIVVQRFLRPGSYHLTLRVQDVGSGRYFRHESDFDVPSVARRAPAPERVADGGPEAAGEAGELPAAAPRGDAIAGPAAGAAPPAATRGIWAEADSSLGKADYRLKILPPPDRLLTGRVRVQAVASGEAVAKVGFRLNGRPIMTKARPPFSVELDLGPAPRVHALEAVGFDSRGRELARDRIPLNTGPHRFAVRLLEPRPGRYRESLRAFAEVDVPSGQRLDRVEIYVNETRVATLYQPPFSQPIRLSPTEDVTYVRALAFLDDGNSTEDLVFVNMPENMDEIEVDFVELYTSVVDKAGRLVPDLERGQFRVFEDGAEQRIRRFERVRDRPIHAGVLLDTSTSMAEELRQAEQAALRFFQRVIQPRDRAAVIVFADQPQLKVPLTNSHEVLAGGLAGLAAEGETALYDSVVFGLYYFAGIRGKRALVLISDGEDSGSRHSYREMLDFARHTGVAVYTIGMNLEVRDTEVRGMLMRLARETGGASYFIERATQLERIYEQIEEELRSQYLIGYQSSQLGGEDFREVEVQLAMPGLRAKTIPGYYP